MKWIQHVVNDHPDILNRTIDVSIGIEQEQPIEWLSPAFAGSHGLPAVEECGCPPKPWRRRTGASAGYAVPQVPRAPARGAPPKAKDDYAEYRDQAFLDLLGIKLRKRKLKDFWPNRGPQWDALGRIENKAYFLLEAKAHVSEIISSSLAGSPASKALINKSLNETKDYLKLNPDFELTKGFYQYSNRLAHLYLLRELNNIPKTTGSGLHN